MASRARRSSGGRHAAGAERGRFGSRREARRAAGRQGTGVDEAAVYVPRGEDSLARGAPGAEQEHGLYALAAAPGGVKAAARAEERGGVILALGNYARRTAEVVGSSYFRDVEALAADRAATLVSPGHVQAGYVRPGVGAQEVQDGRRHLLALPEHGLVPYRALYALLEELAAVFVDAVYAAGGVVAVRREPPEQ